MPVVLDSPRSTRKGIAYIFRTARVARPSYSVTKAWFLQLLYTKIFPTALRFFLSVHRAIQHTKWFFDIVSSKILFSRLFCRHASVVKKEHSPKLNTFASQMTFFSHGMETFVMKKCSLLDLSILSCQSILMVFFLHSFTFITPLPFPQTALSHKPPELSFMSR